MKKFLGPLIFFLMFNLYSQDLQQIKSKGELRHLGVKYANFVTGNGDGLSVEIAQGFAKHLGVKYVYVESDWKDIIPKLIGRDLQVEGNNVKLTGTRIIEGDLIANGLTRVAWREKIINFSSPTFPTQVWLIARSDSSLKPIEHTGSLEKDIQETKKIIGKRSMIGKLDTCLDPKLYDLDGENVKLFSGSLNFIAPAVLNGESETAILDVADVFVAMEKFGSKLKVIGPISELQDMGVGFRKESKDLYAEFQVYLKKLKADGTYKKLILKYYPMAFDYFAEFFHDVK